jgi:hypothetical protein
MLVKEGVDQLPVLVLSVRERAGDAAAAAAEKRRDVEGGLGHGAFFRKRETTGRAGCPVAIP